jgi:2-dehydro-3-deoxyphosphogluconate aldolase/(4S)-4-hydroxy-2-oxoglutarate aldolase
MKLESLQRPKHRDSRRFLVEQIIERLKSLGVVPVVSIVSPGRAGDLGKVLVEAGLPVVEVTFRTPQAGAAIAAFAKQHPKLLLGAGTVIRVEQAEIAVGAGAQFVVSPGFAPDVVEWCLERAIPVIPGVATATEIQAALAQGCRLMKFFPAELMGGPAALRAQAGPFGQALFMPSGGVNLENLGAYLQLPNVVCCAGSWLAPQAAIDAADFRGIQVRVSEAVELVRSVRRPGGRSE